MLTVQAVLITRILLYFCKWSIFFTDHPSHFCAYEMEFEKNFAHNTILDIKTLYFVEYLQITCGIFFSLIMPLQKKNLSLSFGVISCNIVCFNHTQFLPYFSLKKNG